MRLGYLHHTSRMTREYIYYTERQDRLDANGSSPAADSRSRRPGTMPPKLPSPPLIFFIHRRTPASAGVRFPHFFTTAVLFVILQLSTCRPGPVAGTTASAGARSTLPSPPSHEASPARTAPPRPIRRCSASGTRARFASSLTELRRVAALPPRSAEGTVDVGCATAQVEGSFRAPHLKKRSIVFVHIWPQCM